MKVKILAFRPLLFLAALLITTVISAQEMTITGTVVDASSNELMIGATIVVKGNYLRHRR